MPRWAQHWSQQAFGRKAPWTADPIGDVTHLAAPRLTHRYGNRAILHLSAVCAMYCRFCFRKAHLNDADKHLYKGDLAPALAYLSAHPEVSELILTGGDPLSLTDTWLARFLNVIGEVGSIRQVRFHTRMPVTLPHRLTCDLTALLAAQSFLVTLVAHFNHPRELTPLARARLTQMRRGGIALYNQTVLLRGINDDAAVLAELLQALYETGVTPYYLHHPDWAPGTFHFRVPIARGRTIVNDLAGRISGPARPHYVLDTPDGRGKVSLTDDSVQLLETSQDGQIAGMLYRIRPPHTRAEPKKSAILYADLWPRNPSDEVLIYRSA